MDTALALTGEALIERRPAAKTRPRWLAIATSVVIHATIIAIAIWLLSGPPIEERATPVEIVIEDQEQVVEASQPQPPTPERAPDIRAPNLAGGEIAERAEAPNPAPEPTPPAPPAEAATPAESTPGSFAFLPQQVPAFERFAEPLRQEASVPPPPAPQAQPRPRANLPSVPQGPRLTQTAADMVRAQILGNLLINWRHERYRGSNVVIRVELRADGTLAFPYGRNDPWNPRGMITNYERLLESGNEDVRVLLEGIVRALRAAQPLQLPPGPQRYPMTLDLSFRTGDR